jgi:proteic killer suppression protein
VAIKTYKDKATRDIAKGVDSKEAKKALPSILHAVARKRLALLAAIESIKDLSARQGLGLYALRGDRKGEHAIKINDRYRICFIWEGKNAQIVEITDCHPLIFLSQTARNIDKALDLFSSRGH